MPLDFDELNKKKNQRFGQGWSPDPGSNEIRVLPPTSAYFTDLIGFIAYEFRNHFIRLEGQDIQVFRCLRDFDERCPACQFYYDNRNDDDSEVATIAKKFRVSTRFAFNIVDLDEPEAGIQTYECGPSVHNEILKFAANQKWGNVLDVEEGRNFTITLTPGSQSKTGYNSYDVMPSPQQTSVVHHLSEGWKDELDGLETEVPERPDDSKVKRVLEAARQLAFGSSGNVTSGTPSDSRSQEQATSGFSADVSEPAQDTAPENVDPNTGEITDENTSSEDVERETLPPRVEGGPRIDPDTDQPVCFGDFDRSQHPCDACDMEKECQIEKLGL